MHVASESNEIDPLHSSENLKIKFETRALKFHVNASSLVFAARTKAKGQTTSEVLQAMCEDFLLDSLVVGAYGRKGEKVEVLGSVADNALRMSNCDVMVVRSTSYDLETNSTWVVSVDESETARLALATVMETYVKEGDVVYLMHSSFEAQGGRVLDSYKDVVAKGGYKDKKVEFNFNFLSMPYKEQSSIPHALIMFAEDVQADFIALGIKGHKREKFGSVSDDLIHHSKHCSPFVIKHPYEVQSIRSTGGQ